MDSCLVLVDLGKEILSFVGLLLKEFIYMVGLFKEELKVLVDSGSELGSIKIFAQNGTDLLLGVLDHFVVLGIKLYVPELVFVRVGNVTVSSWDLVDSLDHHRVDDFD
mgnify:CR=1 FL=1